MLMHRHVYGNSKQLILETLEQHIGEDLTVADIARLSRVSTSCSKRKLRELRSEGLAFSRRAVSLHKCPLVWGRVAI